MNIILLKKPFLPFIMKFDKVFARKDFYSKYFSKFSLLDEDIFSASNYREADHLAACQSMPVIEKLINKKNLEFLSKWGGKIYSNNFISLSTSRQIHKILISFEYTKRVLEENHIEGVVYIWPEYFSWSLYKSMRRMKIVPDRIKIHPLAVIQLVSYSVLRFLYFFLKAIIYPEFIYVKASNESYSSPLNFESAVHIDDGAFDKSQPFEGNKIFKLFDKNTLLVNEEEKKQNWQERALINGCDFFHLPTIVKLTSRIKYLKKFYGSHFSFRNKLILLASINPFLMQACYESIRQRVLWELFYEKFTLNNVSRLMIAENLTSSMVHKKNSVDTIFVLFSSTESVVKERLKKEKHSCNEYAYMISDYVVSSQLSNNFIATLECSIGKYINIGPIFSDISKESFVVRNNFLKILNIEENTKIISFFDHSIGHIGAINQRTYKEFLEVILYLSKNNQNYYFLFKSKKAADNLNQLCDFDALKIINKIRKRDNCIYANDFKLTSLDIIGFSDLIISLPMSSVIYESLSSQKPTISYDPERQYKDFNVPSNQIPNLSAYTKDDLERLVRFWLIEGNNNKIQSFLCKYLVSYINIDANESSINKFKLFLRNPNEFKYGR